MRSRNTCWEIFGIPMFDLENAAGVMLELGNCRKTLRGDVNHICPQFSRSHVNLCGADGGHPECR